MPTAYDIYFMMQEQLPRTEQKERASDKPFLVTIIGGACSGKSTVLDELQDRGFTTHTEPENPILPLFIENPQKYAFENQLHKITQLMSLEILDIKNEGVTSPKFRESGVLATEVYNRYLHEKGLLTDDQYGTLHWMYEHHMVTFPTPDLVVYLHAPDAEIRRRAAKRDGVVAHDPAELQPFWDRLLVELEDRGIPVYRINTQDHPVGVTQEMILNQVEKMKQSTDRTRRQSAVLRFPSLPTLRSLVA